MKTDRADVAAIVYAAIDDWNRQNPGAPAVEKSAATRLLGKGGALDSLGLVHLIVAVEQAVNDKYGTSVTLASERAMSRERSPFGTVDALVDFVVELLEEPGGE